MRRVLFVFGICSLLVFAGQRPAQASWVASTVHFSAGTGFRSVTVTAGREGSDSLHVYATNHDHYLHEYTWNGSGWTGGHVGVSTLESLSGLAVGDLNADGIVYAVALSQSGNLHDYLYNGTGWLQGSAGPTYSLNHAGFGRGRNGVRNLVYAGSTGNSLTGGHFIMEFRYNGTAFTYAPLSPPANDLFYSAAVGDGRNDGMQRVYGACWDRHVYEYTSEGGGVWSRIDMGTGPIDFESVIVGPGRQGSSRTYVYAGNDAGTVYEFDWQGSSWAMNSIGGPGGGAILFGLTMGDGRNDGVNRLYASGSDGHVYEFTYAGGWSSTDLNVSLSGVLDGITVGPGREKDNSVYVCSMNGYLYELRVQPLTTATSTPSVSPVVSPTVTPTPTLTPTWTPTRTMLPTSTISSTSTVSATVTVTPSITRTSTISPTSTHSPVLTATPSRTVTPTPSITRTSTISPTSTITPTYTTTSTPVAAANLDQALVYPNPYRADEHSVPRMTFVRLPVRADIDIYALTGERIRRLTKNDPDDRLVWDLTTDAGQPAASGVYLYIIRSDGQERRGKAVLLR